MSRKRDKTEALIRRIKEIAPGYYTERDGVDWYVVAPNYKRIAEGFVDRNDARLLILWLAGDPMPAKWCVLNSNDLFITLDCRQGCEVTIWTKEACRSFPDRAGDLLGSPSPT